MGLFSNFSFLKRNAPAFEPEFEPAAEPAPEAEVVLGAAAEPALEAEVAAVEPALEAEVVPVAAVEPAPEAVVVAPAPAAPVATPVAEVSSQARAQAEKLVRSVAAELPNFMTVAVVDSTSGQILAGQWAGHSGGASAVASAHAEMVCQAREAIAALQLAPVEQVQDILISLRHQLHLLQVLPQHGWLLYLAIRIQDANLALARTVLRQHAA